MTGVIKDWLRSFKITITPIATSQSNIEDLFREISIEKLCQSHETKQFIKSYGGYSSKHVQIWKAVENSKIIGIMIMADRVNAKARGWGTGYLPNNPNFHDEKTRNHISDLLLICSGHPGMGHILTLLALSLAKSSGLYLQMQMAFVEKEISPEQAVLPDLVGQKYLVVEPVYLESAQWIYRKLGFSQVSVMNDDGQALGLMSFYRAQPLQEHELTVFLHNLQGKFVASKPLKEQERLQQQKLDADFALLTNDISNDPNLIANTLQTGNFGHNPIIPSNKDGILTLVPQTQQPLPEHVPFPLAGPSTMTTMTSTTSGIDTTNTTETTTETAATNLTVAPLPYLASSVPIEPYDPDQFFNALSDLPFDPQNNQPRLDPDLDAGFFADNVLSDDYYYSPPGPPESNRLTSDNSFHLPHEPNEPHEPNRLTSDNAVHLPPPEPRKPKKPKKRLTSDNTQFSQISQVSQLSIPGSIVSHSSDSHQNQNPPKPKTVTKMDVCPHCSKTFNHGGNLQRHISDKHSETKWPCKYCGKEYGRKFTMREHIRKVHGISYKDQDAQT